MEQEKKMRWGAVAIVIAILILAGSIFFAAFKITATIDTSVKNVRAELKEELKKNIQNVRKEAISFIYAYRQSGLESRQLSNEDFEKGYDFADEFLSR
ncbi:hypothetical protein IBX65_05345 [Candidatus Aerophobetes bacterium]|nr:hypothetical protein [Candidatus Aerophobetes bacterium]